MSITNPVELGKTIDDKEFILDVLVELNQNSVIDLELQVVNEGNWIEKTYQRYSDKLRLSVVDLTHIELAAEECVYQLTQDEKIRQQCEAREDYRRRTAGRERMLKEALEKKQRLADENEQLSDENAQLTLKTQQQADEISRLQYLLQEKEMKYTTNINDVELNALS